MTAGLSRRSPEEMREERTKHVRRQKIVVSKKGSKNLQATNWGRQLYKYLLFWNDDGSGRQGVVMDSGLD